MKIQNESKKESNSPSIFKRLLLIAGFVLFSNLFFFHPVGSVAFCLFSGAFFILLWLLFSAYLPQKYRKVLLCAYIAVIGILEIITIARANPVPVLLSRMTIFFLLSLLVYTALNKILFVRSLLELAASLFITGGMYISSGLKGLLDVFTPDSSLWDSLTLRRFGQTRHFIPYIVGGAVGIPVVVFLVALLSADPIFSNYIGTITHFFTRFFTGAFWIGSLQRFILSGILFIFLFPLIYFSKNKEFSSPLSFIQKIPLSRPTIVVMIFVAIILGAFLLVAAPYVFVNVPFETDLSRFGVATYSEYVKRGFGEFVIVSLFVYILLWVGLIVERSSKEKTTLLKWIQYIVVGEFFIFLISLFRRIYLYQQYHGWSLGRLYGGVLLTWVSGITVMLLLRHFKKGKFVVVEVLFTLAIIISIGFFNAENFIATVHPPTVNKRIDYIYLARSSVDGVEGWEMAYDHARSILLETQYDKNSIIGKESRREIAYAGLITHLLTNHYHELVEKYADTNLKMQYYQKILQKEIETYAGREKEKKPQVVLEKVERIRADGTGVNVTTYPTPTIRIYVAEFDYQQAIERKGAATAMLEKLQKRDVNIDEAGSIFYLENWYHPIPFQTSSAPYQFIGIYTPSYMGPPRDKSVNRSWLDQLFSFNYSEQKAFETIIKEISLDDLFTMQYMYQSLHKRIAFQPENERDYEIDISLNSPFLGY